MEDMSGYNTDIDKIRSEEFPQLQGATYVDHAGATLYSKTQLDGVHTNLLSSLYGNPHSRSFSSRLTTDAVDNVRFRVLQFLGASVDEYSVIFTSGCTAALKLLGECFDYGATENQDGCLTEQSHCKGCFCYLLDNHTSVQGMREFAVKAGADIVCLNDSEIIETNESHPNSEHCNCLFAYPAQSNFSGHKYQLSWLNSVKNNQFSFTHRHRGQWYTLLDASSYLGTSPLDLSTYKPDFVTLSFYKIFGYPTGLGALIVHKDAAHVLKKTYFGGGTVAASSATDRFHIDKASLSDRFEDGTVSYLDIISLRHGFDALQKLGGGMAKISAHTFSIAQYFHHQLRDLYHGTGQPIADIYGDNEFDGPWIQGAIVNFNLWRASGHRIGFAEVDKLAHVYNIHLRTGCFCNIGACQQHLSITTQQIKDNLRAGHECGDDVDIVNGHPTGSIRVSFGYMSTIGDAQYTLQFIVNCFLEGVQPKPVFVQNFEQAQLKNAGAINNTVGANLGDVQAKGDNPVTDILLRCGPHTRYLTNICLYPVKSCPAFQVSSWEIGPRGFLYDREWMITCDAGVSLSPKREPRICHLRPRIDLDNNVLVLSYPGQSALKVPLEVDDDTMVTQNGISKVCGDRVSVHDCGDMAADWISVALERSGCRLIRHSTHDHRTSKVHDQGIQSVTTSSISLANEAQFLLLSRASVTELRTRIISSKDPEPIPDEENLLHRFRGNLVVGGGLPFEEEKWASARIGDLHLIAQSACSRCQMVCINPENGQRSKEPLKTLATFRGKKMSFGMLMRCAASQSSPTTVKVGDTITIETS